ncbi:hypothetical protein M422DRAFT_53802 [Sphaerobolus stellatus SS14]|uniref:DNA repair protein REV1 n=1 Tax=Sphaerobolus stellatus (strain SS14) TaxID=990650 RepID=A0A0C9UY57_SPHS4|nr:hypothetical protein M422DRAFT_53802 [Sphaerobolus stellatus SS14]
MAVDMAGPKAATAVERIQSPTDFQLFRLPHHDAPLDILMQSSPNIHKNGEPSSDLFGKDDSEFLQALEQVEIPKSTHMSQTVRKEPSASSDLFGADDPEFLVALSKAPLQETAQTSHISVASGPATLEVVKELKRKHSSSPGLVPEDENDEAFPQKQRLFDSEEEYGDSSIYGASKFRGWGEYMQRKRAKLSIQNTEMETSNGGKKSDLFKGLALHINGKTNPSVQELRKIIVQHGGIFIPYLDKKKSVTHIIASNLTPAKVFEFKNMKVITPRWLLESITAGTILPWRNFVIGAATRADESQGKAIPSQSFGSLASGRTVQSDTTKEPLAIANVIMNETPINPLSPAKPPIPPQLHYGTDPAKRKEAARIVTYASYESNPFAKKKMEDPQWRAENTAIAPGFIEGYYKNSRLHHLATWKSELQDLVAKAVENVANGEVGSEALDAMTLTPEISAGTSMSGFQFCRPATPRKGKAVATEPSDQIIMHCDFDSFFVSAGLVDRPELKGKPVVVCHSQGHGGTASTSEIASSSYEARKYGIKNGMR